MKYYMNNALHNRDCPPLMSDGRTATDYRPSCVVHNMINMQNGLLNSHMSRSFMQQNAKKLMELNTKYFEAKNSCPSATPSHVDPNGNDKHWEDYKISLGWNRGN